MLQRADRWFEGQIVGPESFAVDANGENTRFVLNDRNKLAMFCTCIIDK